MNLDVVREVFDFSYFWEYRVFLLRGLLFNFYVFAFAWLLAIGAGFVVCLLRLSQNRVARWCGTFYVELFRNTPEYVFLVWVHFVVPLLVTRLIQTQVNFAPSFSAILALGISYSGYLSETFRSGFQAIPRGHIDAAHALAMPRMLIVRRIILPQALRQMLPEVLNNSVSIFKATSIISLISVPDLMYQVVIVVQEEMKPLPLYSSAALIFFVLIYAMSWAVEKITDAWRVRGWA
jgi:His/Glu/Gln/Arg/opine family amino acid ABC transporter permease subunit